ncbi:MAG: hypothetical protein ACXV2C_06765 [Candidatus Bathyarchaeia archaeon]
MDKIVKTKWAHALRSGEYPQVAGVLYDASSAGYCCLGVLCKVVGAEFEKHKVPDHGNMLRPVLGDKNLADSVDDTLDVRFLETIGMTDHQQRTLIGLNDDDRLNFNEIADFIESTL